jgi:hypothetical protein
LPLACLALALAAAAGPARAQAVDTSIEQRVRPVQPVAPLGVPPEELILTGRNDLVLLRERQLFELHAGAGVSFTDNAFLSDQRKVSDTIFSASAGLRAATRVGQLVDVFADLTLLTSRYAKNGSLSFDAIAGSLGAEVPAENVRFAFGYTGTAAHARDFSRHLVTLQDLTASARYPLTVAGTGVTPVVAVTRTYADPAAFDSVQVRLAVQLYRPLTDTLALFAAPSLYYWPYDHFFGVNREDRGIDAPLGVSWTPAPVVILSLLLNLSYDNSSFRPNRYTALTAAPSARLSLRF